MPSRQQSEEEAGMRSTSSLPGGKMGANNENQSQDFYSDPSKHKARLGSARAEKNHCRQHDSPSGYQQQKASYSHGVALRGEPVELKTRRRTVSCIACFSAVGVAAKTQYPHTRIYSTAEA